MNSENSDPEITSSLEVNLDSHSHSEIGSSGSETGDASQEIVDSNNGVNTDHSVVKVDNPADVNDTDKPNSEVVSVGLVDSDMDCLSYCTVDENSEFYFMPAFRYNHYVCANPGHLPECRSSSGLTVVIDLDETLVATSRAAVATNPLTYPIRVRKGANEFLRRLRDLGMDIVIWSAGLDPHVFRCIGTLDPEKEFISSAIYRDDSWFNAKPIQKDLRWIINRDYSKCLLIENNVEAALHQHDRTVIVPSFYHDSQDDDVLERVADLVEKLAANRSTFSPVSQHLPCRDHHILIDESHPSACCSLSGVSNGDLYQWFPDANVSLEQLYQRRLGVVHTPYCIVN